MSKMTKNLVYCPFSFPNLLLVPQINEHLDTWMVPSGPSYLVQWQHFDSIFHLRHSALNSSQRGLKLPLKISSFAIVHDYNLRGWWEHICCRGKYILTWESRSFDCRASFGNQTVRAWLCEMMHERKMVERKTECKIHLILNTIHASSKNINRQISILFFFGSFVNFGNFVLAVLSVLQTTLTLGGLLAIQKWWNCFVHCHCGSGHF